MVTTIPPDGAFVVAKEGTGSSLQLQTEFPLRRPVVVARRVDTGAVTAAIAPLYIPDALDQNAFFPRGTPPHFIEIAVIEPSSSGFPEGEGVAAQVRGIFPGSDVTRLLVEERFGPVKIEVTPGRGTEHNPLRISRPKL